RTLGIAIVDLAIAPGEGSVFVGEISEITALIEVAPGISASVGPLGGVFPFRFRWQTILPALTAAEPLAKLHRVEPTDVNNGVTIAGGGGAFTLMKGVECFVMRISDGKTRYVEAADGDTKMRCFVRRRARKGIAHDEFSRWNEKHLAAK